MKAMLFAAGLGTRLRPITHQLPKALARVNGKTLLEHNIRYLQRSGIYEVVVNVHHFADLIENEISTHSGFGSDISVSDERLELLETGGGLARAISFFENEDSFLVMNVDILTNLDLRKMMEFHQKTEGFATLAVSKRESGRYFLFDSEMRLHGWKNIRTEEEKIALPGDALQPYAFSGIQILSPQAMRHIPFSGKFSLVDVYLYQAARHVIRGFDHTGDLFVDVGKPESISVAEHLFP